MTETGNHSIRAAHAGPILYARGTSETEVHLAALVVADSDWQPPALVPEDEQLIAPSELASAFGWTIWRYAFALPRRAGGARYALDDRSWTVQTDVSAEALRIAYTACNGQEHDDLLNPGPTRNTMWGRLAAQHRQTPFTLLLQGGDQLYADDVWQCHDELRRWHHEPDETRLTRELSDEAYAAVRQFYWSRYIALWAQADLQPLLAEVPSLMMWDDHDIFDGWGSHAARAQACPVWRAVYTAAREAFALFQLGARAEEPPAICDPRAAPGFGWCCRYGDIAVVAPDLRSERTPERVMGERGWAQVTAWPSELADCRHVFVMSSVPALGPRFSWAERFLRVLPGAQSYEDDLRDQWQSRAHREEWRRFLETCLALEAAGPQVTLLSGEIHLATRAAMPGRTQTLHQLVASGIAHPAPPAWYARILGGLASVGENPVAGHRITLHPLPGRDRIYTAQRNYLVLARASTTWHAWWETEADGPTPPLDLA